MIGVWQVHLQLNTPALPHRKKPRVLTSEIQTINHYQLIALNCKSLGWKSGEVFFVHGEAKISFFGQTNRSISHLMVSQFSID